MIVAIAAALCAAVPTVSVVEPTEVAALVLAPAGAARVASTSTLLRHVADELETNTDLVPREVTEDVRRCRGQLACLVRLGAPAPYVLVLTVLPGAEADRISAVLIDVVAAKPMGTDDVAIEEQAALGPTLERDVATPEDITDFFARFFRSHVRAGLERAGHWRPFGEIVVAGVRPEDSVSIDGRPLGPVRSATIAIVAPIGRRRVVVDRAGESVLDADVSLAATGTRLDVAPPPPDRTLRLATRIGASVAVGVGLLLLVLPSEPATRCFGARCDELGGFVRAGGPDEPLGSDDYGPTLVPIGGGLIGAGAISGLSTFFLDNELWAIAVGLVAGGVTTGLLYAVGG